MNENIVSYYKARANEYEGIYNKPERQNDLSVAAVTLQKMFADKEVFEIACGTGYWTEIIAKTAHSILATDINENVIEIAKTKHYSPASVSFQTADIFNIINHQKHQSLFGGFIWSHIKLQELSHFVNVVNSLVESGGTVVLMDNKYVEGSNTLISETDEVGNTYQMRKLEDETIHKVLKNFPDEAFVREVLKDRAADIRFISLDYFWMIEYKSRSF